LFASRAEVAGQIVEALSDADPAVRSRGLAALRQSREPPPLAAIEQGFARAHGEAALGLIELIVEREDDRLPARLAPGFAVRSNEERRAILTAIAGHTSNEAFDLVLRGLQDSDSEVQRAALLRLLPFSRERAAPAIRAASAALKPELQLLAAGVERELASRAVFPFLGRGSSAPEAVFPSRNGLQPVVSPDRQWVAYLTWEAGRNGMAGMGRASMESITRVARIDGSADRAVSDMFFAGWMSDSRRVGSARDGFAAIVDLDGRATAEFGRAVEMRSNGDRMPHTRSLLDANQNDALDVDPGEDAAFSPDGQWFGPRNVDGKWQFIDTAGRVITLPATGPVDSWRASWSPDGTWVFVFPVESDSRSAVLPGFAAMIRFRADSTEKLEATIALDSVPDVAEWGFRKGRWSPWSKDGRKITFVKQGQVWISRPDGSESRQLTFDSSNKLFPTFSPDGQRVAYITWQFDNRESYTRLGPTDIWVVDTGSTIAARVTRADSGRIQGLDWINAQTLIHDRQGSGGGLRTASLQ
jgi:hypothetical protein